eukprot:608935-Prymnesium_polylepis.1
MDPCAARGNRGCARGARRPIASARRAWALRRELAAAVARDEGGGPHVDKVGPHDRRGRNGLEVRRAVARDGRAPALRRARARRAVVEPGLLEQLDERAGR